MAVWAFVNPHTFRQALHTALTLPDAAIRCGCMQVWVEEFQPCHQECFFPKTPPHSLKTYNTDFLNSRICHNHPVHSSQILTLILGHILAENCICYWLSIFWSQLSKRPSSSHTPLTRRRGQNCDGCDFGRRVHTCQIVQMLLTLYGCVIFTHLYTADANNSSHLLVITTETPDTI